MERFFLGRLIRTRASVSRSLFSSALRGVGATALSKSAHGAGTQWHEGIGLKAARGFKTGLAENLKRGSSEPPAFAFAFDIDGVLLHEKEPIPGAAETLRLLDKNKIPYILLTNGGGKRESERVAELNDKLGVSITTESFVQSHTPFQELLEGPDSFRDKTVLVTGSHYEKCRDIMLNYGFRNVLTPADIFASKPSVFPFQPVKKTEQQGLISLPQPIYSQPFSANDSSDVLSNHLKIDAMFVLNDPRDWALDIQIFSDLLLSHQGYMGTYSPKNGNPAEPNCGWQSDGQPRLYFSNADLVWSAAYHLPRFGQGAFQYAMVGLWDRITGGHELQRTCIGKPFGETYRFAERMLDAHWKRNHKIAGRGNTSGTKLKSVYMIGDNPESDIAGANGYRSENGTEWVSVLVKTGVWDEARSGAKFTSKELEPKRIEADVKSAVGWALEREGFKAGQ